MNRDERRRHYKKIKSQTQEQFWKSMNELHTRAYAVAERQYGEAMSIVLTEKQKQAVIAKVVEIREQWDGMSTVTVDDTEGEKLI